MKLICAKQGSEDDGWNGLSGSDDSFTNSDTQPTESDFFSSSPKKSASVPMSSSSSPIKDDMQVHDHRKVSRSVSPRQQQRQISPLKKKSNNPCLVVSSPDRERDCTRRRLLRQRHHNNQQEQSSDSPHTNNNRLACAIQALKCSSRAEDDDESNDLVTSGYHRPLEEKYRQSLFEPNQDDAVQWKEDPSQQSRSHLSTQELNHEISKCLPSRNDRLPVVVNFADFDCDAALEAVSRRREAISDDHPNHSELTNVGSNEDLQIFSDDTPDEVDETESTKNIMVQSLGGQLDAPMVVQNLPLTPMQDECGRLKTDDSSDTPTTCNRSLLSPQSGKAMELAQSKYGQSTSSHCSDDLEDKNAGKPPRRLMQKSLALGDALSPDDESPHLKEGHDVITNEANASTLTTTGHAHNYTQSRNDFLQLSDIGEKKSQARLLREEKKVDTIDRSAGPHQDARPTMQIKGRLSQENVRNDEDGSFSSVSSFSVTSTDVKSSSPQLVHKESDRRKSSLTRNMVNKGNQPTPRPFFWKTHPPVTFKSYHFQQPKPKMRRVIPAIEQVNSMDSFSTFGNPTTTTKSLLSSSPARSEKPLDEEMKTNHASSYDADLYGHVGKSEDEDYSPYMHPTAVRKIWADSFQKQKVVGTEVASSSDHHHRQQQEERPSTSCGNHSSALHVMYSMASTAHRSIHAALSFGTRSETSSSVASSAVLEEDNYGALV
ncbi:hypothetical protein IV203_038443 [Nitzschia inconspicua]|uniref:Uncharacterized protein n=1 Tax=Nitzschia inconspicua TaxID=303405 RepID=A0A9K3LMM0_9STRA|nr:hypothetical protein IV203_038443 [Nitzschia inconspicua]